MSLATWIEEFYPIAAGDTTVETAVQHSLTKWIGLRRENLDKHGVDLTYYGKVMDREGPTTAASVWIDSNTCALCYWHFRSEDDYEPACLSCPLAKVRAENGEVVRCDKWRSDEKTTPYGALTTGPNPGPEPMITWLQRALEAQNATTAV